MIVVTIIISICWALSFCEVNVKLLPVGLLFISLLGIGGENWKELFQSNFTLAFLFDYRLLCKMLSDATLQNHFSNIVFARDCFTNIGKLINSGGVEWDLHQKCKFILLILHSKKLQYCENNILILLLANVLDFFFFLFLQCLSSV